MKDKIKNFFIFLKSAWTTSSHGKLGVLLFLFSIFMFIRIFYGEANVQRFVMNIWHLNREKLELSIKQQELNTIKQHNRLLRNLSADYVEELGLQELNLGNPKLKELKY